MATNEFTIKNNFDVVSHINSIPNKLFDDGFRFVSFDVKSLFTNIPLTKTINIILQRIYDSKLKQQISLADLLRNSYLTHVPKLFSLLTVIITGSLWDLHKDRHLLTSS